MNSSDTDQTIDWKLSTSNQGSSQLRIALRWTIWRLCSPSQHLDNWLSFQMLIEAVLQSILNQSLNNSIVFFLLFRDYCLLFGFDWDSLGLANLDFELEKLEFFQFYLLWYALINKWKGYIKQSQLDCRGFRGIQLGELKLYLFYWHLHSDWANLVGTLSTFFNPWNLAGGITMYVL